MSLQPRKISDLWRKEYSSHINDYSRYQINEQFERIAALFAPGESYFYILNMHNLELDYVSSSVLDFSGISPENVKMEQLLDLALPEEVERIEKKEQVIKDFFNNFLKPSELSNYKIVYSYKMRDCKGKKRVMFHQATVLGLSENEMPQHVLSIHSDISHIAANSTSKVSFINLKGGRSYFNVRVDSGSFSPELSQPEPQVSASFTAREKEILELLTKGHKSKQIAEQLNLSVHTVTTHRKNILEKSGCKNTAELIAESMMAGVVAG